jgi:hypothetical protein
MPKHAFLTEIGEGGGGGGTVAAILAPDGRYYEVTVDNQGRITTVDIGTTEPPDGPPPYATVAQLQGLDASDIDFTPEGSVVATNVQAAIVEAASEGGGGGGGGPARVVNGGNLGTTETLALAGDPDVWLRGTLNANCVVTVTGLSAGCRFILDLAQDGVGGHTLTISDGTTSTPVAVSTVANAAVFVLGYSWNGSDITIDVAGSGGGGEVGGASGGVNRGAFQPDTSYALNDIVSHEGAMYYAVAPFTSATDFDLGDWLLFEGTPAGGTTGQVLTWQADGTRAWEPPAANPAQTQIYTVLGENAVGSGVVAFRPQVPIEVLGIESSLGTSPSSAHVIDAHLNGATMFTTQANRPTIEAGQNNSGIKIPDVLTATWPDAVTFDIDQVGGSAPSPTFVVQEAQTTVAGPTTTASAVRPALTQTGDLLIVSIRYVGAVTWSAPGFTQIGTHATWGGANTRVARFWRIDDGAAGPFTFTASGNATTVIVRKYVYRNTHQTTPIGSFSQTNHASSTAWTLGAHTTANNGETVLILLDLDTTASITAGHPAGYTSRVAFITGTSTHHSADGVVATAGALGTLGLTLGAAKLGGSHRIGIRPGPAVTPVPGSDLTISFRYREI